MPRSRKKREAYLGWNQDKLGRIIKQPIKEIAKIETVIEQVLEDEREKVA